MTDHDPLADLALSVNAERVRIQLDQIWVQLASIIASPIAAENLKEGIKRTLMILNQVTEKMREHI